MQKLVTVFFVITTAIFGCLYFIQAHQTKEQHAKVGVLEEKLKDKASEVKSYELIIQDLKKEKVAAAKESKGMKVEILEIQRRAEELENRLQQEESQLDVPEAPPPAPKGMKGFGKALGQMMKDPEMKRMIREQQKVVLDMTYGGLFEELGLSEEEIDTFKDLLLDKQMSGMELGMSLMEGDIDELQRQEIGEKIKQEQEKVDSEIKEFLGHDGFAIYEEYSKTIGERMMVDQFKRQPAISDNPLEAWQEDELIQAMVEERKTFQFTTDFEDPNNMNSGRFPKEQMDTYLREKEELDGRIFERAHAILTPEQLEAFKATQTQQLKLMEMGMRMATEMFGSEKEGE